MGKMLPVDSVHYWNSTDIVCRVCGKAFGGLTYDTEDDVFIHRDDEECGKRLKKSRPL